MAKAKNPAARRSEILLLEDDPNLGFILQEHLQLEGFAVTLCTNGLDGLRLFRRGTHVLCLVDVMMPAMDGFTFARKLRAAEESTPIIFLTAKSLKEDKIEGFRIGCDDYITKPFSMEELMLRLRAVLRRSVPGPGPDVTAVPDVFDLGRFVFDQRKRTLRFGTRERKLTGRESDLLRILCLHRNRILDRDVALKSIWGSDTFFNGRSMDVFISRLRRYLRNDRSIEIQNVHGRGYMLVDGGEKGREGWGEGENGRKGSMDDS